uniref:RING-type domain-containing protein n=1 Tax=Caenorhabditis japonica TaxID=281687 RepID=A0A8R1I648_CAEJA
MSNKEAATINSCSDSDNVAMMIPSFLPEGEILGWNLSALPNPLTKKTEYTYTVSIQTNAFRGDASKTVMVVCDGPCGNKLPSNHLITMGKCDHMLCKACYGLVKNPDGSYGCSNFYCWADAREPFRQEKAAYRKVINKQICRARKLKRDGEDVISCTDAALPHTPYGAKSDVTTSSSFNSSTSLASTSSSSATSSCAKNSSKKNKSSSAMSTSSASTSEDSTDCSQKSASGGKKR